MQKHSIKLTLRKSKTNKIGQNPIYIKVTISRKTSYISTGYYINKKMWDTKNECVKGIYPDHEKINADIANKRAAVLKEAIHASLNREIITAKSVKQQVLTGDVRTNFFVFAEKFIKEVTPNKQPTTIINYQKHIRKLKKYHNRADLTFEEITPDFLIDFGRWLRGGGISRIKPMGENYARSIFVTMRTIFNAAKKKKLITVYPFSSHVIPKVTKQEKEHLSMDELDKLEKFVFKTNDAEMRLVGAYFLFGCYSGLRLSDWRKFNRQQHIIGNDLKLMAKKNNQWVLMPIHQRLQKIIDVIDGVPLVMLDNDFNVTLRKIAAELKIPKYLSTHSGRKTFAVTICLEKGVSSETAAELMGITLKVFVDSYSRVVPEKIKYETSKAWSNL